MYIFYITGGVASWIDILIKGDITTGKREAKILQISTIHLEKHDSIR